MKTKFTIFLFVSLLFFSCKKDENIEDENVCYSTYLETNNLVPYTGQEVGCDFFVNLFAYEGELYFQMDNHCIDIAYSPITDCEGNDVCAFGGAIDCTHFYENMEPRGIFAVQE